MQNDKTLILQAQRGDMQAFETLVHRYDSKVLAMALSFTQDPDEAKDVYQEVFIRVYRALPRFEFRSKFSTWVHRIVVNTCRTHQSKRFRRGHVSLDEPIDGESNAPVDLLESNSRSDEGAIRSELRTQLNRAVLELSPKQRLVFGLRHYHGYKLREIASMMDCAEGTVKRHLFTATRRLRHSLSELHEGEEIR